MWGGGGGGRLHEFICIHSVIPVLILVCTMNMGFDQFTSCQGTEFADLFFFLHICDPWWPSSCLWMFQQEKKNWSQTIKWVKI